MKVETYVCDFPNCGVQKKDANHWWRGYQVLGGGIVIMPWQSGIVALHRASEGGNDLQEVAHLCGAQHALEWASKNLLS